MLQLSFRAGSVSAPGGSSPRKHGKSYTIFTYELESVLQLSSRAGSISAPGGSSPRKKKRKKLHDMDWNRRCSYPPEPAASVPREGHRRENTEKATRCLHMNWNRCCSYPPGPAASVPREGHRRKKQHNIYILSGISAAAILPGRQHRCPGRVIAEKTRNTIFTYEPPGPVASVPRKGHRRGYAAV